jgi:hypothetical protein
MRTIQRELEREFPFATVERTGGGHLRLTLPNGRFVIAPATPSDWRALDNLRAMVRRALLTPPNPGKHL